MYEINLIIGLFFLLVSHRNALVCEVLAPKMDWVWDDEVVEWLLLLEAEEDEDLRKELEGILWKDSMKE